MSDPVRVTAESVSLFTLDTASLIDDLEGGEITFTVKDKEGKACRDTNDFPVPVGKSIELKVDLYVSTLNKLIHSVGGSDPVFAVVMNCGPVVYTGNALLLTSAHKFGQEELQKTSATFKFRGVVTIAAPSA